MTVPGVEVLETTTRVTPLGVRFRDAATGNVIGDGLAVTVHPKGEPELRSMGRANRFGIYVFRNLPYLHDAEWGRGDTGYWNGSPPLAQVDFVLEVRDAEARFLPFRLDVRLPLRNILGISLTSPMASPLTVVRGSRDGFLPLYSAPSRNTPEGMGVLRAELVDGTTPAAWALVEAKAAEQRLVTGMADERGHVMLPLLYPKPVVVLGSPGSPNVPVTQQTWTVQLTVRYRRRTETPVIPDLADVLTQPAATIWSDTARTIPLTQATLQFARDLFVASQTGTSAVHRALFITPAGSPP